MRVEITFAELHSNIFINGKNMGPKLYPEGQKAGLSGLSMVYDEDYKKMFVSYLGAVAAIPDANISCFVLKDPLAYGPKPETPSTIIHAPILTPQQILSEKQTQEKVQKEVVATESRIGKLKQPSAQVAGPASHVFADAPGKVRD